MLDLYNFKRRIGDSLTKIENSVRITGALLQFHHGIRACRFQGPPTDSRIKPK